jgi:hypothetical protein
VTLAEYRRIVEAIGANNADTAARSVHQPLAEANVMCLPNDRSAGVIAWLIKFRLRR